MSSTSPYVSLSSHYRFLHYIGSEPNPFAVITPNTVQQRGAVRLRFHTPTLIQINSMVNENVAESEAESNEQIGEQKLLKEVEVQEEHDKEKSFPYVYVMPLTSEDVYPKLTTNNINDGDVKAQSTWTTFSTLELAQECCRRDVGWDVERIIKREQDDSLYSMHSVKKSKLEQKEQQVEEHQEKSTVANSADETDNTIVESTHEITKTSTTYDLSNLKVMRFVKEEVVIRTLLQVLLILQQPRHSSCVQFTVETFSPSTLTFTVRSAKEEEQSCNVNSLMLRVTLSSIINKVREQHKLHLTHVKKDYSINNTNIYTNLHCICNVLFDNQETPHIADFSSNVIVLSRQVFDYVALTHNTKAKETNVPIISMLSEPLEEQSLNTIMLSMCKNSNYIGLFSMIFDYNAEENEEEEEQKQREEEVEEMNESTTGVRETETKSVMSESERIITHVRERGFVFCALCAHYYRVESIKWHIMQSTSWKHYYEYAEKDKAVLRILHLMPLQDHKIRRSTTWESIM